MQSHRVNLQFNILKATETQIHTEPFMENQCLFSVTICVSVAIRWFFPLVRKRMNTSSTPVDH